MSTVRTNNVQVGQSLTATNNFTLYQPTVPDGTVRLGVGNTGATTADVITANSSGNVGIGTSSPTFTSGGGLQVKGAAFTSVRVTSGSSTGIDFAQATDGKGYMYNRDNADILFGTNNTEQARITSAGLFQFNSGYGSVATAYGCRAWVNFNGTGTVAIRASGNVSSITDGGTGDYTVNFTTAMPDTSYAGIGSNGTDVASGLLEVSASGKTTSGQRVISKNGTNNSVADQSLISVAIFR